MDDRFLLRFDEVEQIESHLIQTRAKLLGGFRWAAGRGKHYEADYWLGLAVRIDRIIAKMYHQCQNLPHAPIPEEFCQHCGVSHFPVDTSVHG